MKGLMVALLTLLTAGLANAQQEDEGGTFKLVLSEENFEALLRNKEGLIATIPPEARQNVTRVVVKLEDAVRENEFNRMTSTKPTMEPSSQTPALDPTTSSARRPSVTQDSGSFQNRGNSNNQRQNFRQSTLPNRSEDARTTAFERVAQDDQQPTSEFDFLRFGDDSDFAPVVNRNSNWLKRQRATTSTNDEFEQFAGQNRTNRDFQQTNQFQRQPRVDREPLSPRFNGGLLDNDRNRNNDIARNPLNDFNNPRNDRSVDRRQNNDFETQQLRSDLSKAMDVVNDMQTTMNQQNQAMQQQQDDNQALRRQLARYQEELDAQRRANLDASRLGQDNLANRNLGNNRIPYRNAGNYSDQLTHTGYDLSPRERIARNDRQPIVDSNNGVQPLQIQGPNDNDVGGNNSGKKGSANSVTNADALAANSSLKKANNFLLFMLLASIGLNIYLGLISRTFYTRYEELADELRETFTATM